MHDSCPSLDERDEQGFMISYVFFKKWKMLLLNCKFSYIIFVAILQIA